FVDEPNAEAATDFLQGRGHFEGVRAAFHLAWASEKSDRPVVCDSYGSDRNGGIGCDRFGVSHHRLLAASGCSCDFRHHRKLDVLFSNSNLDFIANRTRRHWPAAQFVMALRL